MSSNWGAVKGATRRAGLVTGVVTLASVATAFVMAGCGEQHQEAQVSDQAATTAVVAAQPAKSNITSGLGTGGASSDSNVADEYAASPDALPPDVAASAAESQVSAGGVAEITAMGSDDVEEVLLSDGIGKAQPMVYDTELKAWHAYYRVPVKPRSERVALSVTAKNADHRWRRVWVFLNVAKEIPQANDSTTDSTTTTPSKEG
jgi:hypothetical protein